MIDTCSAECLNRANHIGTQDGDTVLVKQAGNGAALRTVANKLHDFISPEDYGAIGDGVADDSLAFRTMLDETPSGATIYLGSGKTYRQTMSLVIKKPICFVGGTMEDTQIIFAANGSYVDVGDGTTAAIILLHTLTNIQGHQGDARQSSLDGFTISLEDGSTSNIRGIVTCVPAHFSKVRVQRFTSGGFNVVAAQDNSSPLAGIANGSSFTSCASYQNGTGYYFCGNDANACLIIRCGAHNCTGWGFYDDGFLGNTFIGCESDSNILGGYYTNAIKPISSAFVSCYSETAPHFEIGPLCQIWGGQGLFKPNRGVGGVAIRGLPDGAVYCSKPIHIAETDDIANSLGESPNSGAFMGVSDHGLTYKSSNLARPVKLNNLLSTNYAATWFNGDVPIASFPNVAFTGNIDPKRWHLHEGFTVGGSGKSGIIGAGVVPPTAGNFETGAIWLNDSPSSGGKIGWICVSAGTPGTWKAFGAID